MGNRIEINFHLIDFVNEGARTWLYPMAANLFRVASTRLNNAATTLGSATRSIG